MSEFSKNYKNLKDQISDNDSKVIPYLIFGIVIGRIFEKIVRTKKRIFKKRRWEKERKKLSLLLSRVQWL